MSHKQARIPAGLKPTHRAPICSACGSKCIENPDGEWFCLKCADEWLGEFVRAKAGQKTKSGIHLPVGVTDPAKMNPSFRDVMPNRATRRRMARASRRARARAT